MSLEARLLSALRSPRVATLGTALSVFAFAFLVRRLMDGGANAQVLQDTSFASLFGGLIVFLLFQVGATHILGLLGGASPARLWASAQIVKYLPIPGSALLGMAGGAVRCGRGPAEALRLVGRHTGVLAGGAVIVGAPAFAGTVVEHLALPMWPCLIAAAITGLAGGMLAAGGRTVPARLTIVAVACVTWAALGIGLWATVGAARGDPLMVASSFPAAWVVGLAVLPVPAGLGIRELVLAAMLEPQLGPDGALAYGVLTRALQVASDGLFAIGVAAVARQRHSQREGPL